MVAGRSKSITTNASPSKKWVPLATALILIELGFLALNAGVSVPGMAFAQIRTTTFWLKLRGGNPAHARDTVVAQLITCRGALKFRARGSPVWEDPPADGLLHAGQSLRTLEHGAASLALFDGSALTLDENSRIELDRNGAANRVELSLVAGGVHRRLAESAPRRTGYRPAIEISAPEAGIDAPSDGEFSLHRSEGSPGMLELHVLAGEVALHSLTGSFLLKPGEEAVETSGPDRTPNGFEFRKMPFVLLLPQAAQTVGMRARFEWNVDPSLTSGSPLELQISLDPTFEHIVKTSRIASTEPPLRHVVTFVELPTDPALENGNRPLYWRVRALTDATVVSDASPFWSPSTGDPVLAQNPEARPRLRLPLESAVTFADKPLDLVWASVPGANSYEVDIDGRDQPIVTNDLDIAVSPAGIPLGRRAWRVRARLANMTLSPWSDSRTLTVVASPDTPRKPASAGHP